MTNNSYSKEYAKLAKKLKQARIKAGLDQTDLAELLGKTQSYISKVEEAKLQIDIFELKKLSKLFKKDINYFIS